MEKITRINFTNEKKDGTECIDRNGNPFYKCGLQVASRPGKWISNNYITGPLIEVVSQWVQGDEVDIEIVSQEYNGKTYLNWAFPKKKKNNTRNDDATETRLRLIEDRLSRLEGASLVNAVEIQEVEVDDQPPF